MSRSRLLMGKVIIGAIVCCSIWAIPSWAELTVASPFTDHAVLQRDQPVPVWGKADPGSTVTVVFSGQKKTGVAAADGTWMVKLDSMSATFEPRVLTVSNLDDQVAFADVVIGEVWVCSGQSNMAFPVRSVPEVKALVSTAKHIRSFTVAEMVALEEQDKLEGSWQVETPDSAVAASFAIFLQESAEVPVGIILTAWGSTSIEAWMPRDMTKQLPYFKTIMDELDANAESQAAIKSLMTKTQPWSKVENVFARRQSNVIYNAMMHPLIPYACRGMVWYQGERNAKTMYGMETDPWYLRISGMVQYGEVLTSWIERCRQGWDNDQMHFMVVMLPGYGKGIHRLALDPEDPTAPSWAWMREAQLKALELPHTSVVNVLDTGLMNNEHCRNKLPVGQRLAMLAARDTLSQPVIAQGPVMTKVELKGNSLVVAFDHADGLKTTDGSAPSAFWVADESQHWVRAEAEILGNRVVLKSQALAAPRYVRYAFSGMPKVNLVNSAGLPAYPFRTDAFAPITVVAE